MTISVTTKLRALFAKAPKTQLGPRLKDAYYILPQSNPKDLAPDFDAQELADEIVNNSNTVSKAIQTFYTKDEIAAALELINVL